MSIKDIFFEKSEENQGTKLDFKEITSTISTVVKEKYTYFFAIIPILLFSFWIRIQNLELLKGKFLLGLDPYCYFRYTSYILETGTHILLDIMRRAPMGTQQGFDGFTYFLAAWSKIVMSFGQTQMFAHIIYPAVFGVIGFVFFFLFAKELFNVKVALVATAFLTVVPAYLYRTLSGFADHEAIAMVFMFAALWIFVLAYKEETLKKKYLFAAISSLMTFFMALTWGGFVFLTIPIAGFAIVILFFDKATKQFVKIYTIWIIFIILIIITNGFGVIYNIGLVIPLFALIALWINIFYSKLKVSGYLKKYIPTNIQAFLVAVFVGLVLNIFLKLLDFSKLIAQVAQPAETSGRVAHTISEIIGGTNLYGPFGLLLVLGVIGVIYLIYLTFNNYKKTAIFSIPILIFLVPAFFKDYSLPIYLNLLIIMAIIIAIEYFYFYNKQGEEFFVNIKPIYLLPLFFIIFATYLAKSAARFLFLFSPIITLLAGFFIASLIIYAFKRPEKLSKLAGIFLIILVAFLFISNAQVITQQAKHSGSGLPGAWNKAFTWIKENTPEDSIVTHWWDYGYWTQTVGERASTHDGGAHDEYELYILGRYGMTAQTPRDALTFFKTYGVDYLLYSEEEIGKYHAFSYIGSNKDFDRRSTIGTFGLQQTQEIRDGVRLIYSGQWGLDKDVVINNKVYSEGKSAILGFTIDSQGNSFTNPIVYLSDGSNPIEVPISCLCIAGQCIEEGVSELGGCLIIIPAVSAESQINEGGAALYLSDKVKDGLFARLYLKSEEISGFTKVYTDDVPLALYNGRIIGPKVIWKVTPPSSIRSDPILLRNNTEVYGYEKDFRKNYED